MGGAGAGRWWVRRLECSRRPDGCGGYAQVLWCWLLVGVSRCCGGRRPEWVVLVLAAGGYAGWSVAAGRMAVVGTRRCCGAGCWWACRCWCWRVRVVGVLLARLAVRQGGGSFTCHTSCDSRLGALTGRHDEFTLRVCVCVCAWRQCMVCKVWACVHVGGKRQCVQCAG